MLQVPQQVEFQGAHGALAETLLQNQAVLQRQQLVRRRLRELEFILVAQGVDGIGQSLHHLIIRCGVRVLFLLLRGVLKLHALACHMSHLKLPWDENRDVLLVDHVHPASDDGLALSRLAEDHVLDQVLNLELLLCVEHHHVLLLLRVLLVSFLVLFVVLILLLVFLILLVLIVFLVLLVFLLILLLLFLWRCRHELAHDLLYILDAVEVPIQIQLRELRLRLLELGPNAAVPEPIGEGHRREHATEAQLAFLTSHVHRAPVLLLVHGAHRGVLLLFLLFGGSLCWRWLVIIVIVRGFAVGLARAIVQHGHQGGVIFFVVVLVVLLLHTDLLGAILHPQAEVFVRLPLFWYHRSLHGDPLDL
mmetsp:Transcript_61783/g.132816  ORF Transcript_61783/g.132816 Transcript_61783/m.132816 type:complete len:362 (-) Transcript_61783:266-1351(-)